MHSGFECARAFPWFIYRITNSTMRNLFKVIYRVCFIGSFRQSLAGGPRWRPMSISPVAEAGPGAGR